MKKLFTKMLVTSIATTFVACGKKEQKKPISKPQVEEKKTTQTSFVKGNEQKGEVLITNGKFKLGISWEFGKGKDNFGEPKTHYYHTIYANKYSKMGYVEFTNHIKMLKQILDADDNVPKITSQAVKDNIGLLEGLYDQINWDKNYIAQKAEKLILKEVGE